MSSRAAVGRVIGRGSQADSAVSKAPAGGALGAMEARRPAGYVGISARRRVHAPGLAERAGRAVHRLVWFVCMTLLNGMRRIEARRGFCAMWYTICQNVTRDDTRECSLSTLGSWCCSSSGVGQHIDLYTLLALPLSALSVTQECQSGLRGQQMVSELSAASPSFNHSRIFG